MLPSSDKIRPMPVETMTVSSTGGLKSEKLSRFDLIPVGFLFSLAEHYGKRGGNGTPGTEKYPEGNWRKGYEFHKGIAAAIRHILLFASGEDIDPETGTAHTVCASWHCAALDTFSRDLKYAGLDDRTNANCNFKTTSPQVKAT